MPEDRRDNTELLNQIKDMISPVEEKIDRVIKALYGNGDSERGLISRVAVNSNNREMYQKRWNSLTIAVITAALTSISSLVIVLIGKL